MPKPNKSVCVILIASFLLNFMVVGRARAEAVDDRFTQISPQTKVDGQIHGAGYGKILMRIMLFGAVAGQGIHYVPEGTDLLFALIYAGGRQEDTKLNGITIRRRGVQNLIEIDLEDILEEGAPVPKLQDGDVISIPYNWRKNYAALTFYFGVFTTLSTIALTVFAIVRTSK